MATTIGYVAGSAIGGPIGGAIGSIVGGVVDRWLFGQESPGDDAAPSMGEVSLQGANEGAGIPFIIGRTARVPGTIIWISDLIEEEVTEEVGGKGGKEEDVVVGYNYFVHMAVAWGYNLDGDISFIERIYANGQLFYLRQNDISWTGVALEIDKITDTLAKCIAATATADLTQGTTGKDATLANFTNSANNGDFRVKKLYLDGTDSIAELKRDSGAFVDETDSSADYSQTLDPIGAGDVTSLTFYTGKRETTDWVTFNTDPDGGQPDNSLITTYESVETGHRELAYTVFEKFAITPFGNQVPQMAALVDAEGAAITFGDAITRLWERLGRDTSEIDVTDLTTAPPFTNFTGFTVVGPEAIKTSLRPILNAGAIHVRETNGQLVFVRHGQEDEVTVTTTHLAARAMGGDAPRRFRTLAPSGIELPAECNVAYIDSQKAYQKGDQKERCFGATSDNVMSLDIPVVMTGAEARKIARRELWNTRTQFETARWTLPPRYLEVTVGDRLTIPVPKSNDPDETEFESYKVVVNKILRQTDWILSMEGYLEDSATVEIANDDDAWDGPPAQDDDIPQPQDTILAMMDIPPLGDALVETLGIYWATCAADRNALWKGAVLYESLNDTDFTRIATADIEAKAGFASTVLADGPTDWIDYENTVDVIIFHGSLSGISESEMLQGQNIALLGDEIIAFTTATLQSSAGKYRLSGLLRGLRDTADATSGHAVNEAFVLLESTTVGFKTINQSDLDSTRYYRSVASRGSIPDYDSETVTLSGNTTRPFSPYYVRAERPGPGGSGNDITVRWERRTRHITAFFSFVTMPLLEDTEKYEIDVYSDNTFATLKATYTVEDDTKWLYTSTAQSGDGLTPGAALNVEIFQISSTVGRSKAERGTDI